MLHEVIGGDHWTDEDHQAYPVDLRELLKTAAADGFDVLSDSRDERIQESGSSDHESYTILADAGARRCVQVVSPAVVAMQTGRMVRESGAGDRLASCGSRPWERPSRRCASAQAADEPASCRSASRWVIESASTGRLNRKPCP